MIYTAHLVVSGLNSWAPFLHQKKVQKAGEIFHHFRGWRFSRRFFSPISGISPVTNWWQIEGLSKLILDMVTNPAYKSRFKYPELYPSIQMYSMHWFLGENLNRKHPVFTINLFGLSCKFSHPSSNSVKYRFLHVLSITLRYPPISIIWAKPSLDISSACWLTHVNSWIPILDGSMSIWFCLKIASKKKMFIIALFRLHWGYTPFSHPKQLWLVILVISSHSISILPLSHSQDPNWLVGSTILKNDGVRQLGWWNSQLNGKS